MRCPHCGHDDAAELPAADTDVSHSTCVINPQDANKLLCGENYRPNPDRVYRTPEYMRRVGLAYYYQNRERILARMKEQRRQQREREVR